MRPWGDRGTTAVHEGSTKVSGKLDPCWVLSRSHRFLVFLLSKSRGKEFKAAEEVLSDGSCAYRVDAATNKILADAFMSPHAFMKTYSFDPPKASCLSVGGLAHSMSSPRFVKLLA